MMSREGRSMERYVIPAHPGYSVVLTDSEEPAWSELVPVVAWMVEARDKAPDSHLRSAWGDAIPIVAGLEFHEYSDNAIMYPDGRVAQAYVGCWPSLEAFIAERAQEVENEKA